jgi:hypothetical protein
MTCKIIVQTQSSPALHEQIDDLEQAHVDKIIAACPAKIGEVAFAEAYAVGRKMTLAEAMAYALEGS